MKIKKLKESISDNTTYNDFKIYGDEETLRQLERDLRESFGDSDIIEDKKEAILSVYEAHYGSCGKYIEQFLLSHGASLEVERIFENVSDEAIEELYDRLKDRIIKLYGPDYDELSSGVFELFGLDTINEDVSKEWKPDTSFKHIKDIYNKVKANNYKYVNNEREEFMAAVRKADTKGYKPDECRQIKDWHRDIWSHNRNINENLSEAKSIKEVLNERVTQFKVGDEFTHSGLYGGTYTSIVKSINGNKLNVETTWTSEDDGSIKSADRIYKITTDDEGNECIVVWEYNGFKGYVYPPSSKYQKTSDSPEDIIKDLVQDMCSENVLFDFCNSYEEFVEFLEDGNVEPTKELYRIFLDERQKCKDEILKVNKDYFINEDLSGKYSDKFRQFIRNYTDSATIVGLVDDIVRYAKEDDLKDLYFERGYDTLEKDETVDNDVTESFKLKNKKLTEDMEDVETVQRYLTSELPDILLELSDQIDNIYDSDVAVLLKNCRSFYNLCESMVRYYNRHSNLEEDLTDVATATLNGPTEGPQFGLTELINTAMQNELETVNEYNTLALNARTEGFEDIANVIDEINTEENKHIGQLQELLKTISPNAQAIEVGNVEGTQQLSEALSGAELKDISLVLTQIFTKESNGEKANTISKIIELIPEDLVDDVINLISNKLSSIEIGNTDKDKIKSLANSDADLSNSDTLGEIFKLINIDEFANENPGLIKTFLTTVLGIIAAIEPTPVLEVVTFIVGILPENLLVKLLAIINPFVGMLKLGSKLLSKKRVKEDIETVNNSNKTPNTNDEEVLGEDTVEDWSTVYNKFKQIEQEMNGDGEAITAIIDNMYKENKGNPSYEKAYSMWLKDTIG